MATTVHIPDAILSKVEARAKTLNVSRNRFIVQALERALESNTEWAPEFLEFLRSAPPLDEDDGFLSGIVSARRSKERPVF